MKHYLLSAVIMTLFSGASCQAVTEFACTGLTLSKTVNGYRYTVMGYDADGKGTTIGSFEASSQEKAEKQAESLLSSKEIRAKNKCVPDSKGVMHVVK